MQLARGPIAALATCCACASSAAPSVAPAATGAPELAVPFGAAPVIDGKLDATEWSRAVAIALEGGVRVRVMHDGARVYLGVSGPQAELGFACVVVAEPDQIRVLHASYKLGSAIYTAGTDGRYHPRAATYDWRAADVLWRDEGWMGTTIGDDKPREQELVLSFAALGLPDHPRRIALGYFYIHPGKRDVLWPGVRLWPPGLEDAVANVELLAGENPDDLRFDPSRWIALRPQPR